MRGLFSLSKYIPNHHINPPRNQKNPARNISLRLLLKSEPVSGVHPKHHDYYSKYNNHKQHQQYITIQKTKSNSGQQRINTDNRRHPQKYLNTQILSAALLYAIILPCLSNQPDAQTNEDRRRQNPSCHQRIIPQIISAKEFGDEAAQI